MGDADYPAVPKANRQSNIAGGESPADAWPDELAAVLLYQDRMAGLRARQVLEEAAGLFIGPSPFNAVMWRFDLLEEPLMGKAALNDSLAAVIFLLSFQAACYLPASVNLWLDEWLSQKSDDPCALIVSFDVAARHQSPSNRMVAALQSKAGTRNVTVFPHYGPTPRGAENSREEEIQTGGLPSRINRPDAHRSICRHSDWGINE